MYLDLCGDGIRDDTAAIQQRIDSGICELILPAPQKFYLISRPLVLPSNFRLVLPRFAEIRLAKGSNCVMVKSKTRALPADRLPADMEDIFRHILAYVDDCDPDFPQENIEITGGIWNCNNQEQSPNPMKSGDFSNRGFPGFGMLFYNVKNLKLSCLTVKDPLNYGIVFDTVSHFTAEDITFDYNKGNPLPITMDGLHICGNCHYGAIRNLRGACYDDMLAINADDGSHGPVSHITVDGLFAENCHSAVRLLSVHHMVSHVRITNVFGTFFQYCIGITKYFPGVCDAGFEDITLEHIHASKAPRTDEVYPYPQCEVFPVIWLEQNIRVGNLTVRDLYRSEQVCPVETIGVRANTVVERLYLQDIVTSNRDGSSMPLLVNDGTIRRLDVQNVRAGGIVCGGMIEHSESR